MQLSKQNMLGIKTHKYNTEGSDMQLLLGVECGF